MGATVKTALRKASGLAARGEAAEAAALYAGILARFPGNRSARDGLAALGRGDPAAVLTSKGIGHHRAGRLAEAADCYARALALDPDHAEALGNLGAIHLARGDMEKATLACARAVALKPGFAEGWNNLGIARRGAGESAEALAAFSQAAELNPDNPEILKNLGSALASAGRPEIARKCLAAALSLRPDHAGALKNLARLTSREEAEPLLERARALRAASPQAGADRMRAAYAVATLARTLGHLDETLAALDEAGGIGKRLSGYDPGSDTALFAEITQSFDAPDAEAPLDDTPLPAIPVFVLGMPRSGTSLAEQILASHPEVAAAGERMVLSHLVARAGGPAAAATPDGLALIREGYRTALRRHAAPGIRMVTDKMPLNFRWIGHILRALPEAKILHMTRRPQAVCWSCYRLHFPAPGMAFTFDQRDLARYGRLHADLMAFWHDRFPGRIRDICYEALTEAPEARIRAMLGALGLPWVPDVLDFHDTARIVETASAGQVRKPIYRGSSEDWRRFSHGLGPMLDILGRAA